MSVSIIIPTLNEEDYISDCLNSLLVGLKDFKNYQILIVDGKSDDGTVKIVNEFCKKNDKIEIINNPKKTAPSALNLGLEHSKFDIIIRCDAHAYYPPEYIKNNFDLINESDEKTMNVGGYVITKSKKNSLISKSIANVLSSPYGVGNSRFRTGKKDNKTIMDADTVPFGCFKRKIFKIIGNFNESEPGNEDIELNNRILKNGYKIKISNSIYSHYYSRPDIKSFLKQTINNGLITTKNKNFTFRKWRHYIPFFFFLFLFLGFINFLTIKINLISNLFFLGISTYFIFIFTGTISSVLKNKQYYFLFIGPLIFFKLHFFYGLGSFMGLFILKNNKKTMSYNKFLELTFPIKNPFKRKTHGLFHNSIKFFALLFSYICFRLKITANLIDFFGLILIFISFILINNQFLFSVKEYYLVVVGYFLISFVLFIDFVDGQLARVNLTKYLFGNNIDNFNPDLIRIFMIIYPGILSENLIIFLMSNFSAFTFIILYGQTYNTFDLKYSNYIKLIRFFFGLRFLFLILFPVLTLLSFFEFTYMFLVLTIINGIYFFIALGYYYLCSNIKVE